MLRGTSRPESLPTHDTQAMKAMRVRALTSTRCTRACALQVRNGQEHTQRFGDLESGGSSCSLEVLGHSYGLATGDSLPSCCCCLSMATVACGVLSNGVVADIDDYSCCSRRSSGLSALCFTSGTCWPMWGQSGFCTSCCKDDDSLTSRGQSGTSATCYQCLRSLPMSSPLESDEKKNGDEASEDCSCGGAEIMNKIMQTIRDQAYAECKGCTVGQMMGKRWESLVVGWTFALNLIIEELPEFVEAKRYQNCLEVVQVRDFLVECLLGQALRMVRLCCFLEKTGVIAEIYENEEAGLCDHTMHGKLRGGMQEPGYEDNDWIVVKKSKKNLEEMKKLPPKKTFYGKAKFNFDALAAASPGNAEEASWECNSCDSSSKDSEETQEAEVLRGGALGSATTNRKRQVADAVGQMEAILQSLQTQRPAEASQDEIGAIINDMKKTLAKWEETKPTKEEMKGQIATLLGRMKTSAGDDGPTSKPATTRQSFYTEFQKEAVRKYEENRLQRRW